MTPRIHGRPAATSAFRPLLTRALLALALSVPAAATLASPVDDGAPFPTKQPAVAESQSVESSAETGGEPATDGDSRIGTVLQKALALLGTPYRWGGSDPDKGFDCSGLVGYVFRNALGIELPRVSRDMAKASRSGELITDRAKLVAGDLVFFGLRGRINHVGIYLGNGRFVHAPSRGKDVTVSSLEQGYWSGRFLQARRVGAGGT